MSKRIVPSDEVIYDKYVNGKMSAIEIAREAGTSNSHSVLRSLKSMGVEIRKATGENHGMWRGGRIECKGDGYIGIWKPDHERADSGGYVYEHTLIAEEKYGRLPIKGEVVHHINCDKLDNNMENLFLCNHKEHISIHRGIEKLIKPLIEAGVIEFDEKSKRYTLMDFIGEAI